jgi:hypothetical protein
MVIELVLATDMACHADVMRDCLAHVALLGTDILTWPDAARLNALKLLLHCADIGNTTKPAPLCILWAEKVMQGERAGCRTGWPPCPSAGDCMVAWAEGGAA